MEKSLEVSVTLFFLCVSQLVLLDPVCAVAVELYPFGSSAGDSVLSISETGASSRVLQLTGGAVFYGTTYSKIIISSSGVLGLGNGNDLVEIPSQQTFPLSSTAIIAPFWTGASHTATAGRVHYRVTSVSSLLQRADSEINLAYMRANVAQEPVNSTKLVVVTWENMRSRSFENTFQCVIAIGSTSTYIFFHYANNGMQWTGQPPALVGFNAGNQGGHYFSLPTSNSSAVLEITRTNNTQNTGKWMFRVDGAQVTMPGTIIGFSEVEHTTLESNRPCINVSIHGGTLQNQLTIRTRWEDITTNPPLERSPDYEFGRRSYTFSPSSTTECNPFPIINDLRLEFNETLRIILSPPSTNEVIVLLPSQTTVTIIDDDSVIVKYRHATYEEEEGRSVRICPHLVNIAGEGLCDRNDVENERPIQVSYTTSPGTAEAGIDYRAENGTITFPVKSCRSCATLDLLDDDIFEELETFQFSLSSNDPTRVIINSSTAEVHITDASDGRKVKVGFVQTIYSAAEGDQVQICTQMREGQISHPIVLTIQTSHDDDLAGKKWASDDQDFIFMRQELVFLPSNPQEIKCVNMTILRDTRYEEMEYRAFSLTTNSSSVTPNPSRAFVKIENLNTVNVTFEKNAYQFREGPRNRELEVCANLTGEIERSLTVDVDAHEGTASIFNVDTHRLGEVHVPIKSIVFDVPRYVHRQGDSLNKTTCQPCVACTTVELENDNFFENLFETFSLSLRSQDENVHITSGSATVSIMDDETVTIIPTDSIEDRLLNENSEDVPTLCIKRRGQSNIDIAVQVIPQGLTATESADFVVNSDQIIIRPHQSMMCDRISLTILDDLVVEENETLRVVMESVNDEVHRIDTSAFQSLTLTIRDNDVVSVGFMEPSSLRVNEGEGSVEVCVQMTGLSAIPLSVDIATESGTARAGIDFSPQSITVHFPPTNQSILDHVFNLSVAERMRFPSPISPPICANVSFINDNILESIKVKQFTVNLSSRSPAVTIGEVHSANITIIDDDALTLVVDEASLNVTVTEGESIRVCARMLGQANFPVSGSFQPVPVLDSAQAIDFSTTAQHFSFPANSTGVQCVNIHTTEDSIVERPENFEVELSITGLEQETRVSLGENSTLRVTIVDNDFVEVGFEESDYPILEGEGNVTVCATLQGRLDRPISVLFSIHDPPSRDQGAPDYHPVPSMEFFGELSTASFRKECVTISIANDTVLEDTESFDVVLSSSDSVVNITRRVSRVHIIDDDGVRVGLKERTLTVSEGEGATIPICVELVGRIQHNIEAVVTTSPLSAHADSDYNSVSHTLTFLPETAVEQMVCMNISVIDDLTFEDDESFEVNVTVDHTGVSYHIHQTIITILDDDSVTISLVTNETAVQESDDTVDICVSLSGPLEKNVPYQLTVNSMEALAGSDFRFTADPGSHFSPFAGNSATLCHRVTIINDEVLENTEYFEAVLEAPVGIPRMSLGTERIRVAILDEDIVRVGFTQTSFTVDEDADDQERRTEVCVELSGEIDREILLSITSQTGTASAEDFAPVNEAVTFSPGVNSSHVHCLSVFVHHDRFVERNETFSLVASSSDARISFSPETAHFTITDEDVVCAAASLDTSRGYFTWQETYPQEIAEVQCENGTTTRFCSVLGEWEKPNISDCYVSAEALFKYIDKHGFSENNLRELLFATRLLVREKERPKIKYARTTLKTFLEFADQVEGNSVTVDSEIFGVVLEIVNALQTWPQSVLMQHSSRIVQSFEKISLGLFKHSQFPLQRNLSRHAFFSNKIATSRLFPQDKIGLHFSFHKEQSGRVFLQEGEQAEGYEASIMLPKSIEERLRGSAETGLFLSFYDSGLMFPLEDNDTDVTAVVAASFAGRQLHDLKDNVIIKIKLGSRAYSNLTCVSWSFEANDALGSWTEDGCQLESMEDGIATCACSHLTNFALLVDIEEVSATKGTRPRVERNLNTISIVGVCVSILGLVLTIITLLIFGKLRKKDSTKFRVQLCVAIIVLLLAFVTGVYQVQNSGVCVAASALIHYFTLATFMWMAADCLLTIRKLLSTSKKISACFMVIVSLICWLLPLPAVVVPIAINKYFTVTDQYCFIGHDIVFYGAVLGPIAIMLLFTIVVFLVVTCVLIAYSTKRFNGTEKAARRARACRSVFGILGVLVLFSSTWAFGALTVLESAKYFEYLFVAFSCIQGFFVFIIFVMFAKETQDLWLQACGCKKRKKREVLASAITGSDPSSHRPPRMTLDENAERLRAMEEMDLEMRLKTNTWDVMYIMPQNQFDVLLCSDATKDRNHQLQEQDSPSSDAEVSPTHPSQTETRFIGLSPQEVLLTNSRDATHHSPTHSIDSTQNAVECLSTADSGILMEKGKTTPSPTLQDSLLQHPQSGSTPRHVHSVSGIGYVSAESSMETLPQSKEDCFTSKNEPITLAPSLRPRAIPNEYARVHVD